MMAVISEGTRLRDQIATVGKSLFERGLTFGSTGNISARLSNGDLLMTPTDICLGSLDPGQLSHITAAGEHLDGDKPTKEAFLHRCMYCQSDERGAVIHLHSTYAAAVSCLADIDPADVLPPLTAYYVMRVGSLPLVDYFPPGDQALADAVREKAADHHAILLANHGPVVAGKSLLEAQFAIEELEETAKLFLLLDGRSTRPLTKDQRRRLRNG
jgi:3-dehydro-4-phosphotetronate decarboxylase